MPCTSANRARGGKRLVRCSGVRARGGKRSCALTSVGRVAVSAHALIGCGLSCGQASLRSGPSPGRPELGRRGGGLKHAGRYSPRRSCPSLGLPKSRRALPAPRPNSLQHSGAHFDAHAVTPITPITPITQSASNARRVGGSLTARRRTITPTSQRAVSATRSSRLCLRLQVERRRARGTARSSMRHLRSRTACRRGGSHPSNFGKPSEKQVRRTLLSAPHV